ncbi:MAG: hypothetical protein F4Z86_07280 [Gemmatimonadetes bacterium]|nr:hypothetical protein [Gemmatimonadota bacterium]MYB55054.1 hypothetical protein [Gemmatimonadota bacterium]MYD59989.1 hypothetical protein [Gemmatimonadota bacterium]
METITHAHVQELANKLPETKLSPAFHFLQNLVDNDPDTMPQENFASLSIDERRRILAQQAKQMKSHYEQTRTERTEWQAGDFGH